MSEKLTIRPVEAKDEKAWVSLWQAYCATLNSTVPEEVTSGVWQRFLTSHNPTGCLLACKSDGEPVGFATYVLHYHTWSLQLVCYLEDLFVAPQARRHGAARALIKGLETLGKEHGWRRVYWHTHEDNYPARALYDKIVERTDYVRYDLT